MLLITKCCDEMFNQDIVKRKVKRDPSLEWVTPWDLSGLLVVQVPWWKLVTSIETINFWSIIHIYLGNTLFFVCLAFASLQLFHYYQHILSVIGKVTSILVIWINNRKLAEEISRDNDDHHWHPLLLMYVQANNSCPLHFNNFSEPHCKPTVQGILSWVFPQMSCKWYLIWFRVWVGIVCTWLSTWRCLSQCLHLMMRTP